MFRLTKCDNIPVLLETCNGKRVIITFIDKHTVQAYFKYISLLRTKKKKKGKKGKKKNRIIVRSPFRDKTYLAEFPPPPPFPLIFSDNFH